MAHAQRMLADDIPLIEEHVDTGLTELLAGYRSPYMPAGEKKDTLNQRFTLFPQQALPDLDNPFAKAYHATDDFTKNRQIYAMVMENRLPCRAKAVQTMLGQILVNVNFGSLLGAGAVHCSHLGESRYVLFLERPHGVRLSAALKLQPQLHPRKVVDYVIQPAVNALLALRERKLSHGNIYPDAFFASETVTLSECYTAPCGSLGHYIYQPLERMMCDPLSYGEANEKSDVYSLGVLVFDLLYGVDRFKAVPKEDFIRMALAGGTYQIFTRNRDFPENIQDFLRGTLNDNPLERWGLDQLVQWLGGKRFNMIVPILPKDGVRPLNFAGEQFLNRRLLAHALHVNWPEAVKDVRSLKLDRWCETSLLKADVGERIERVLRAAGETASEKQTVDMMTRIIAALDPSGPIRNLNAIFRPDAIGLLMADRINDPEEMATLLQAIESDIGYYWSELSDTNKSPDMAESIQNLQRMRPFLKNKALGFGVERVLYDLNPTMPCQSPLLKAYHITNAADALRALDALATKLAPNTSFADRHLAAFMGSRIALKKEVELNDLGAIPTLMHNEELIILRILARVQQKHEKEKLQLVGLATWAAMRIERMVDEMHNRLIRRRMKLQLKRLASTGNLSDVLALIVNQEIATRDYKGFTQAIALHQINHKKIERYENPRLIEYRSREMGGKMAMTISYIALSITTYVVFSNMFGF